MSSLWAEAIAVLPPKLEDIHLEFNKIVNESLVFLLKQTAALLYEGQDIAKCLQLSQTIIDFSWERLNIGTWRDVDKEWRRVFSYGCLFKAVCLCKKESAVREAIKTCDKGLLMGMAILDNILIRLVKVLQNHNNPKKRALEDVGFHQNSSQKRLQVAVPCIKEIQAGMEVPRIHCPSLEHFRAQYLIPHKPVILQGIVDHWPAVRDSKWSVEYIHEIAGCRTVPVELGSRYTDDEWSQTLMTVGEFIDKYILHQEEGNPIGYLAQHQLFEQVDVDQPDLVNFPEFESAEFQECILSPGDVLFIPVSYWHYVRSLDVSFSVSFWWS
ncbi:lysine-specific demethylase 8 isoform X7 [Mobula birostris]|uniref:lysine-specific demethylase 8 isoform X7 n=1 Tax=Mobula birostris TaxID=1983395 RepID=UPI003B28B799